MAIKSKSFLKSKWLKACALLLALIAAGGAAASAYRAVLLVDDLGGTIESLVLEESSDFTGSNAFQEQLARELYYIRQMIFVYGSEEEMRSGESLRRQEQLLREEYEADLKEELEVARRQKEEELAAEYGYAEDEATQVETNSAGKAQSQSSGVVLTEEEKELIRSQCQQQYEARLNTLRSSFDEEYRTAKQELESLSNLHYALINRETGEAFTNLLGVNVQNVDLQQQMEGYQWNETYTQASGYHSGERVVDRTEWMYHGYDPMTARISEWFGRYSSRISLYERVFVDQGWDVYIALNDDLVPNSRDGGEDLYYTLFNRFMQAKAELPAMLAVAAACLAAYLIFAIYLTAVGGLRAGEAAAVLLWTDRIPNDLHLVLSGMLVILGGSWIAACPYQSAEVTGSFQTLLTLSGVACAVGVGAVVIEWLTSAARNIRRRRYWRNTLMAMLFRLFKKNGKRLKKALANVKTDIQAHALPRHQLENLRASILFLFAGYLVANVALVGLTMISIRDGDLFTFLLFGGATALFNILTLIFFWKSVIALDEMMTAASKMRQGDLNYPLDPAKMPRMLRKFGEDIVGMQEGMRAAVEEAIKGEHMKTELITNVSHDLKTPLTAIVNYVDLLKKCNISDAAAKEYITVLEEKSARLKRLIEDLVEASKATTGNMKLQLVRVNLYELAMQAVGENEDALEAAGLEIRLNTPEEEPILHADSQKTWRIIDNLISNVKKYALTGTRVYIDVGAEKGFGVFTIKNISRDPLDVPVEQLTQRFVRGDASRSTEGSGLGLSIAQSLCELQRGTLEISLDGDLFKAVVRLPLDTDASNARDKAAQA